MLVQELATKRLQPEAKDFFEFFNLPTSLTADLTRDEIVNEHFHSAYVMKQKDRVVGRFALYVNPALKYAGQPTITIGSYACVNDSYIASQLLKRAEDLSSELGYNYIIGPMNGSTWQTHRFTYKSTGRKFCLDLSNPDYYNSQFSKGGYDIIGRYYSTMDKTFDDRPTSLTDAHWKSKGLTIRNIRMNELEIELERIATFSNDAFSDNFLFTPIATRHFVEKYIKLAGIMDPQHIWICEDRSGVMQAILFAIPDFQNSKQLVVKTGAVRKGSPCRGITTYIFRKITQTAKEAGYTSVVHAFMHEENLSFKTSKYHGHPVQEYLLYGKKIIGKKYSIT